MRSILQIISLLALIALTLPSVLFLAGRMEWIMIFPTIVWFITAAPWMWKDNGADQQETG
jgi:hypothetical protein